MGTVKAFEAHGGARGGLVRGAGRHALLGLLLGLALVAAACDSAVGTTTTAEATETTAAPAPGTTTAPTPPDGFIYQVGTPFDIQRPNFWAYKGPFGTTFMERVFGPTKPSLFRIAYPGIVVAPDAAAGRPMSAVQEGEVWTVTQPIRDDYTWSDGTRLTADDIVFTFETARDAGLTATWATDYPYAEGSSPRLLGVEALDDFTVEYTFDAEPGAAVWPHTVGVAPIMPKAPWEPLVAAALETEDPATVLYDSDSLAVGDLSGGPVIFDAWTEGVSVETIRNDYYANEGFTHQFWSDGSYALNGELLYGEGVGDPVVDYTEGPYLERTIFSIYDDSAAGVLALINGDIDFFIPPGAGYSPTARRQGLEADNLAVTVNPTNGFIYLGFNLRKSPGKFLGFRQAMAYFDKENLTNNVLQGAFTPLYVMVPEGNRAWYDEEIAREMAGKYVGLSADERLTAAYAALATDGFTWATPPVFQDDGTLLSPGAGIIDPEGIPVPNLELLSLSAAEQPQGHTAALWLEDWAENLGIPTEADAPGFDPMLAAVWPGPGTEPTFDMVVFGWALGNPAWPTFHEAFFHTRNLAETNDGGNATGYSNPEFDALADAMFTETDQSAANDQVWQMERIIARDLPYVVLLTSPVTEFYNKDLTYPFTNTLGGIQNLAGMQEAVFK